MHGRRLILLGVLFAICAIGYMTLGAKGSWDFLLPFRAAKLAALILVAVAISTSTVLFQTVTHNRILTPSIMGFDALFVLIVTFIVFFFGIQGFWAISEQFQFLVSLLILVGLSLCLFGTLLLQEHEDLIRMILTGLVLAVLFRSLTSFAARMFDPNEYSVIQFASYARFSRIETDLLGVAAILIGGALVAVWRMRHRLDVLALGREAAVNLGENPKRSTIEALILISVLVSAATAFVGPVAFLGLLVVSIAHTLTPTGRHTVLLASSGLIAGITLIGGQTVLERILGLTTPLTVVIDFIGGMLFLALVLKGVRR